MSLQVRVKPRWPIIVAGTGGVTVTLTAGRATIGFDYDNSELGTELAAAVASTAADAVSTASDAAAAEAAQAAAEAAAGSLTPASQAEAEAGTINDKGMTPLRVRQAGLGVQTASSLTAAEAVTDMSEVESLLVLGDAEAGDGHPMPFVSRLTEPAHAGKTQINGVWYELERHDGVYITDFGAPNALGDDGTIDHSASMDCVTALTDAIDYCKIKRRAVIRLPSGIWTCKSGGIEIPVGINLIGHGHSSSQLQGGTCLQSDYDESTSTNPFIHYTGDGQASNATGGGMQNITLQKGGNKTGGTLLRVTGVNDSNRPGYMTFANMKISGTNGTADCDYCVIVDGSNLTTESTQGLRDVTFINIWTDGWVVEGTQLINATHCKIFGYSCSPTGAGTPGLRITGLTNDATSKTTGCTAYGIEAFCEVVIDKVQDCVISLRATDLTISADCTDSLISARVANLIQFGGGITRETLRTTNGTILLDGRDDALYTGGGLTKVLGARKTGWATATGTATRTSFVTSTVTLPQLAERVKALIDDLHETSGHGVIGT